MLLSSTMLPFISFSLNVENFGECCKAQGVRAYQRIALYKNYLLLLILSWNVLAGNYNQPSYIHTETPTLTHPPTHTLRFLWLTAHGFALGADPLPSAVNPDVLQHDGVRTLRYLQEPAQHPLTRHPGHYATRHDYCLCC